jgi:hypothetical protein
MNQPQSILHHDKPFIDLLDDAVWCCAQSQEIHDRPNPKGYVYIREDIARLARLSVLNAALALEALANILLQQCSMPGQLADDVDKLSVLGKFDIYMLSRGGDHFMDRGHKLTQAIVELIKWRNACVHPKIAQRRWTKISGSSYASDTQTYSLLKIPKSITDQGWNPEHGKSAIRFLFEFITHYLLGWCSHSPLEMRDILFDEGHEDSGEVRHYCYQPSRHMNEAISHWKLDARFLCLWVSKQEMKDGFISTYGPGYPEDILVSRVPHKI